MSCCSALVWGLGVRLGGPTRRVLPVAVMPPGRPVPHSLVSSSADESAPSNTSTWSYWHAESASTRQARELHVDPLEHRPTPLYTMPLYNRGRGQRTGAVVSNLGLQAKKKKGGIFVASTGVPSGFSQRKGGGGQTWLAQKARWRRWIQ